MVEHRSLREKQRQEREDLILQAAEEVLLEKGYHEMPMEEIASRVGIAKGTLYLHFSRKEDMVCAIIERQRQALLDTLEQIGGMPGSMREKLTLVAHAIYAGMSGKRMQILYALYNSIDLRHVLKERKDTMAEALNRHITALLEEGKRNGEFDATLPTSVMSNSLFGLLSPLTYQRLVIQEGMPMEDVLHHVLNIYFRGIEARVTADV